MTYRCPPIWTFFFFFIIITQIHSLTDKWLYQILVPFFQLVGALTATLYFLNSARHTLIVLSRWIVLALCHLPTYLHLVGWHDGFQYGGPLLCLTFSPSLQHFLVTNISYLYYKYSQYLHYSNTSSIFACLFTITYLQPFRKFTSTTATPTTRSLTSLSLKFHTQ